MLYSRPYKRSLMHEAGSLIRERPYAGEYLLDFVLWETGYGPRILCESQWQHLFGQLEAIEWAFDKLRGVKGDIKVLIYEREPGADSTQPPNEDANRPAILFQASANASQPTYTAAGALAYAQYGYTSGNAAITLTRAYDHRNRVMQQTATSGANALYSFTGSYQPNGNLSGIQDSVGYDWTFGYDPLKRLTSATGYSNLPGQALNYTYDSFGNRLTQSITGADFQQYAASASYNNNNQATSTNLTAAVGYDQAGNITNDGVNSYAIDAESRVCSFHDSVLNENWTNVYDAGGHRVAKGQIPSGSSCYTGTGFVPTETDVLGQSGRAVQHLDVVGMATDQRLRQRAASGNLRGRRRLFRA
jgi:YD repeat-containing protein